MNRTVKNIGRAALVPVTVAAVRYAWKAFSPAIAESMPMQETAGLMQERMTALRRRLDRSGASEAAAEMLEHDKKALKHAKAGEMRKWQALRAGLVGSPVVHKMGDKIGGMRSGMIGWQAKREAGMAKKHKVAAMKSGAEAEKRKWQAVSAWLAETGDMLRNRTGNMRAVMDSAKVQDASKRVRNAWAEYGWGTAHEEREAIKRRNNIGLGLMAGLGIGAGVVYLMARRRSQPGNGYGAGQAQSMYYTGAGSTSPFEPAQRAVDQAMRQTEASFDSTTAAMGSAPARELGVSPMDAGIAPQDSSLDEMLHGEETNHMGSEEQAGGEAWIVIPQEQWAEFIQRMSDSHQGWNVRVENDGNLSLDDTPVDDAYFTSMQLEPSMARPGVRMFVGKLPQEFLEHVIADLRSVEHLPSDEDGYQGVRLTTTMDRVTIRFTDPGEATDVLYQGD